MNNPELLQSFELLEREKNIPKAVLVEALRQALLSACRKTFPNPDDFDVQIDALTGEIKLLEAGKEVRKTDFGRIAAQTAKQVIIQKIREAERESIFDEFHQRQGVLITGTVHRVDKKAIIVDLGRTEGILPLREQFPQDTYRQGDSIRSYVLEVKKTTRGPEIILSRSHPELVRRLFEMEVPEVSDAIVEIKGIAREAGARSKVAVLSKDQKVDCVGSCVGMRGQRVKNIVRELAGEKMDIVRWSDDPESYIRNALSPAELSEVKLHPDGRSAEIFVADDQLSLAIGKKGQNVRLASKLTGWTLDIRSLSQKIPLSELDGVGPKTEAALKEAGYKAIKDILKASAEDLAKVPGIGEKTAARIIEAAHRKVLEQDTVKPAPSGGGDKLQEAVQKLTEEESRRTVFDSDVLPDPTREAKEEEPGAPEVEPGREEPSSGEPTT